MELTQSQRSSLVSEMASSKKGFNELLRILLESFSKHERALFVQEHAEEQCNGFRPRSWSGYRCSLQMHIHPYSLWRFPTSHLR